jgi:hypothetical protein
MIDILYEAISSASTLFFLLKLDELKFAKWFKDILQIALSYTEMNVTHIESMKWDAIMVATGSFWISCLTVLLCFSKLCDDWDSKEFLSGELYGERDGFFLSKLDVADAAQESAKVQVEEGR